MKKRKCVKGIKCGNSCINANLVCRKKLKSGSVDVANKLSGLVAAVAAVPDNDGFNTKIGAGFFGEVFSNGNGEVMKVSPAPADIKSQDNYLDIISSNVKNSTDTQNLLAEAGFAPKVLDYKIDEDGTAKVRMEELIGYKALDVYTREGGESATKEQKKAIRKNLDLAQAAFEKAKVKHNDLHGGNVMVNSDGDVKVIDYDFAAIQDVNKGIMKQVAKMDFRPVQATTGYINTK